jgi:hypothetical protein
MKSFMSMIAGAIVAVGAMTGGASATQIMQSFDVVSDYSINSAIIFNTYGDGSGFANSYYIPSGDSVLSDGFPKDSNNPPLATFFMGLDSSSPDHLVIAFNSAYAQSAVGQEFSSLFSGWGESDIVSALIFLGTPGTDTDVVGLNAAITEVFSFGDYLTSLNALTEANNGQFDLIRFSEGTDIGSGTTHLTALTSSVPEPSTWAMLVLGFAGIGLMTYRRRKDITPRLA